MKLREEIADLWSAFNEWRVKGWKLRVVVLLLIFAFPLYECLTGDFLIKRLVELANEATLNDCMAKTAAAQTRYYLVRDAKILRAAIGRHFDLDSDGVLDGNECAIIQLNGIKPEELVKSSLRENASYNQVETLAWFAKRYSIVSRSYSVEERRREAFYAGLASVERERAAGLQEMRSLLNETERPDFRKSSTWASGLREFRANAEGFVNALGSVDAVALWLLLCFLAAAYASQESMRLLRFIIAGVALCLACSGLAPSFVFHAKLSNGMGSFMDGDRLLFAGFALLTLAAALKGSRLKLKLPTFDFLLAAVLATGVYIVFETLSDLSVKACASVRILPLELTAKDWLLVAAMAAVYFAIARFAIRKGSPEA